MHQYVLEELPQGACLMSSAVGEDSGLGEPEVECLSLGRGGGEEPLPGSWAGL